MKTIRCAIYTRKSTEEGLDKEFSSLDAQRESAEAFIKSQASHGWICLPQQYDDGGFSGGNTERPALQRLLAGIQAGAIDCVVVYKVDRLSRSLLDFARMMAVFEEHQVSFVSVTQQFNTASSMGRLVLNVLLSFAQFEREIISERTRDKIAAARRKGKWVGGQPLLGYDVDPRGFKLVVNEEEAKRVRAIYALYLEHQGLIPVVQELERLGWRNKRWLTRKGKELGGKVFTKTSLHHLLTNVVYVGKVKYKQEAFPGEHSAIVDKQVWQKVQDLLRQHGHGRNGVARRPSAALLQGLLRCRACGCAMTPCHSTKGSRRYGYYACQQVVKRGRLSCPAGWLPARRIEQLVVARLQEFAKDSSSEQDLDDMATLPPTEQSRLLRELIERVDYDAVSKKVIIAFRSENAELATSD
jgi:site-specific DNA recombinase